jgi:hypothetical protein
VSSVSPLVTGLKAGSTGGPEAAPQARPFVADGSGVNPSEINVSAGQHALTGAI